MVMPRKNVYADIIVKYLESVAVVLAYKNRYRKEREREKLYLRNNDIDYIDGKRVIKLVQAPQSITDITHAVQAAGYLKAHRETVGEYLAKLEEKQVVVKLPKRKLQHNPTQYVLSEIHLVKCLDTLPDTMYDFIAELGTLRRILYVLDLEAGTRYELPKSTLRQNPFRP
jgi:hypothetical protein